MEAYSSVDRPSQGTIPTASTQSQVLPTLSGMSLADLERFSKASPAVASLMAEGRTESLKAAVSIAAACGYHFTVEEARALFSSGPTAAVRHSPTGGSRR